MTTWVGAAQPARAGRAANGLLIAVLAAATGMLFHNAIVFTLATWRNVEEYGYGFFIPVIALFLVWQKRGELRELAPRGDYGGLIVLVLALALLALGEISSVRLFSQYGFIVALLGLSVCWLGWRGSGVIAFPLAFTLYMVPLPQFLFRELSQQMQLLSSALGVALIRLADISVYLEGNVIDLGSYKLQVVQACSGLRYMFPLMALGSLAAYCFKVETWKRLTVLASIAPLTIVINSLRIALIGVSVEHGGAAMAQGLLHDAEGLFMFGVCVALLLGQMALLARVGPHPRPLREVFVIDWPDGAGPSPHRVPAPALAAALLLVIAALVAAALPQRQQTTPARAPLAAFPLELPGGWNGRPGRLEPEVLAELAVDDHLVADYQRTREPPVNFYVAWYDTQSGGQSTHSPRTCIPGGGWTIKSIGERSIASADGALRVNRALIQRGDERQLVYFWFRQRGRSLTSELAVKWYILVDSLRRNRSDGALVRLVTPLSALEDEDRADARLQAFAVASAPRLVLHLPD